MCAALPWHAVELCGLGWRERCLGPAVQSHFEGCRCDVTWRIWVNSTSWTDVSVIASNIAPAYHVAMCSTSSVLWGSDLPKELNIASKMGQSRYREGTSFSIRQNTTSQDGFIRPMTAVRGAGYTSHRPGTSFDPLNQAMKGPSPQMEIKKEETCTFPEMCRPEERIKKLERRITELIEESCLANSRFEDKVALDLAKEASAKERSLIRLQEQTGLSESHNMALTFSVMFNLATQYAANDMYSEALNTYQVITKNRMFNNGNRLKVNMGNIYFRQGQYTKAVKMYRMALDQVPNTHKYLRSSCYSLLLCTE
ncbi:hypothetical protein PR048_030416 [Dryococelus australis]|uniref:Uncharacterized protein n=1 Tax=Dryococelus australis TaxID=614101 RepID=A0ABQ9G8X8_9NEOP|nr:hypothetical protein PR048_030416 [Dryococelus australis]